MSRTVAVPFDCEKRTVGDRAKLPSFRASEEERSTALLASFVLPGEGEARQGRDTSSIEACRLPLLFREELVDGYRALFLSSSYSSKIASTNSRVIITPVRLQRSAMSFRLAFGSLMSSSNVAIFCRLLARGLWPFFKNSFRRRVCCFSTDRLPLE